jgi:hypothetical protein
MEEFAKKHYVTVTPTKFLIMTLNRDEKLLRDMREKAEKQLEEEEEDRNSIFITKSPYTIRELAFRTRKEAEKFAYSCVPTGVIRRVTREAGWEMEKE